MMRTELKGFLMSETMHVLVCALLLLPVVAHSQSKPNAKTPSAQATSAAKARADADVVARLQAQAVAEAAAEVGIGPESRELFRCLKQHGSNGTIEVIEVRTKCVVLAEHPRARFVNNCPSNQQFLQTIATTFVQLALAGEQRLPKATHFTSGQRLQSNLAAGRQ